MSDFMGIAVMDRKFGEGRQMGKMPRVSARPVKIFRSRDYKAIRELCTHPRILPQISDDYTSDPKTWKVPESELVIYLLAADDKGPFGFGIFIPQTHVQYTAHMAFLPRSYGNEALTSFKSMLAWMWANTTAERIVGEIRRDNKLAIRFARRAGFEIYGVNDRSYRKNGVLVDQFCLGISKP